MFYSIKMQQSIKLDIGREVPYDSVDLTGQLPASSIWRQRNEAFLLALVVPNSQLQHPLTLLFQINTKQVLASDRLQKFLARDVVNEQIFVGD